MKEINLNPPDGMYRVERKTVYAHNFPVYNTMMSRLGYVEIKERRRRFIGRNGHELIESTHEFRSTPTPKVVSDVLNLPFKY